VNQFQELFDAQKAYFATGITRSYEWRVEQLDRIGRMVSENQAHHRRHCASPLLCRLRSPMNDSLCLSVEPIGGAPIPSIQAGTLSIGLSQHTSA
jgi:hypothetical protein